jgi:putative ABC transport system ATP-binding protein
MVTHEPDIAAHARRIIMLRDGLVESDDHRDGADAGRGGGRPPGPPAAG